MTNIREKDLNHYFSEEYPQTPPLQLLCVQTSCPLLYRNDFLLNDVDPLTPELEVSPAEVNLRSGWSVWVMYTWSRADTPILTEKEM